MTLYGCCVLLVAFGATMAILDLLLLALSPVLLSALSRLAPARRADAVLFVRSIPVVAAMLVGTCLLLPAWLRHEPLESGETLSSALMGLALLSLLPVLQGMRRGACMFLRTRDRLASWRRQGHCASSSSGAFEMMEVESRDLVLCVGGYLTPTIYASSEVLNALDPDELKAALAHEVSHATARDPLRLLWMGSCPDFLSLFDLDRAWRRAFASACEFAADAGASRGDREMALDLASALLKVARLRAFSWPGGEVLKDVALSSAFSSRIDLEARVQALAITQAAPPAAARGAFPAWTLLAMVVSSSVLGALASESIHSATEIIGRLLAP